MCYLGSQGNHPGLLSVPLRLLALPFCKDLSYYPALKDPGGLSPTGKKLPRLRGKT